MYGNRVMEILYIDLGVPATVEVTDLREIPPLLLKDFTIIPPQVSCLCKYVGTLVKVNVTTLRIPACGYHKKLSKFFKMFDLTF